MKIVILGGRQDFPWRKTKLSRWRILPTMSMVKHKRDFNSGGGEGRDDNDTWRQKEGRKEGGQRQQTSMSRSRSVIISTDVSGFGTAERYDLIIIILFEVNSKESDAFTFKCNMWYPYLRMSVGRVCESSHLISNLTARTTTQWLFRSIPAPSPLAGKSLRLPGTQCILNESTLRGVFLAKCFYEIA